MNTSLVNKMTTVNPHNIENKSLFKELRKTKQQDWETFSKREYVGVWKSVIEKYPETAHFIYELLQNADDALATEASILLCKDKLIFKHNGKRQFTLTDVNDNKGPMGDINSITSVACSTKVDEGNTIGKFGVGFKSVFQYTDTPLIYCDTFWFRIDNYIIPTLLTEDHKLRKEGETLFEIPFNNPDKAYGEIHDRLQKLEMPILFLPHLKKITWKEDSDNKEHIYSKAFGEIQEINGQQYNICTIYDNGEKKCIVLFDRDLKIDNNIQKIYVGYFLDANYNLIVDARPKIHCFFPTGETFDGCFISHAPFLLTDNRVSIKTTEKINKDMLEGIAQLAAEALVVLKEINIPGHKGLIDENLFSIINVKPNNDKNNLLRNEYIKVLNEKAVIPVRGGRFLKKENVIITTELLEDLLSDLQLQQLFNKTIGVILTGTNRTFVRSIAEDIGIRSFNPEDLASMLTNSYMSKQDDAWIDKLLKYIEDNAKSLWKSGLDFSEKPFRTFRTAPIAKTTDGLWNPPYRSDSSQEEPNIMLPIISKFGDVDPSEYFKFLDPELYKKHKKFYEDLGLRKPKIEDYIEKVILPKYVGNDFSEKDMQNDFQTIYKIFSESEEKNVNENIKKNLKFRGYNAKGTENCSLSSLYIPDERLKEFVSLDTGNYFFDYDFYITESFNISKDDINKFLTNYFGLADTPKIISSTIDRNLPKLCEEFLSDKSLSLTYAPTFIDYDLDGYNINRRTYKWSHDLWSYLTKKNNIKNFLRSDLSYCCYHKKTFEHEYFDSSILKHLKEDEWICFDEKTYHKPSDITVKEFNEHNYHPNPEIEKLLGFCENELNSITQELISQAEDKGLDVNEILRNAIEERSNICDFKNIEAINTIPDEMTSPANKVQEGYRVSEETMEIPEPVLKHIDSLKSITNTVGEENLPYVAEHMEDIMDWIISEGYMPSMVRRIINYLGRCIYEQYLINKKISYKKCEEAKTDCDFCINDGQKYIRVYTTQKSIRDYKYPICISALQNAFIRNNPGKQVNIIRISLSDISVLNEYNKMISIYGKEQDPETNKDLQRECEKIARNYWKGAKIEEFNNDSPEYAITIERKN